MYMHINMQINILTPFFFSIVNFSIDVNVKFTNCVNSKYSLTTWMLKRCQYNIYNPLNFSLIAKIII